MNERADHDAPTMPKSQWCPIGPLNAHTYNYERDECIWCGPNRLATKPGRWVEIGDGYSAWSVISPADPAPLSRVEAVEAAEDHADQVVFDAWRERGL